LTVFLGHYAAALAAKKLTPYTSRGTLILAGELADLLWATLLLRGAEQARIVPDNPPLLRLELVSYPWSHSLLMLTVRASLLAALYLFFRRYPRGALVVALGIGTWLYAQHTEPVDRIGRYAFAAFIVVIAAFYLAGLLGPPPSSVNAPAWSAHSLWLFVIWGYWLDRHRVAIRQW
jgi:hypothetical protein